MLSNKIELKNLNSPSRYPAHGDYRIETHGNVVHCSLSNAFNVEGIFTLCKGIRQAADKLPYWVLYIHMSSSAMATPEAEYYSIQQLRLYRNNRCLGIAFKTSNTLTKHHGDQIAKRVKVPFLASDNSKQLQQFIQHALRNHINNKVLIKG